MISPITGANTAVARYWAELKIADAVPRSLAGNQLVTIRAFAGKDGASATPTSARKAKRTTTAAPAPTKATPPCSRVKTDQLTRLAKYTRREPNRSRAHPLGTCASM